MIESNNNQSPQKHKSNPSFLRNPDNAIWLVLGILLAVGLLVITHYGESWDEPEYIKYATASLAAYQGGSTYWPEEKGPFFGIVALIGSKGLQPLISGWKFIDNWHFMTFLAFLMGIYFFYRLCRRLLDPAPALVTTLLFCTQPVLWGHAFFNHQDIPFMAFFLASITLGLKMADHYRPQVDLTPAAKPLWAWIGAKWKETSRRKRRILIISTLLWLSYWLLYLLFQQVVGWLIQQAYAAPDSSWLGQLFSHYARQAGGIPAEAYVSKAQILISRYAAWPWIGLSFALALVVSWSAGWTHSMNLALRQSFAEWKSAPWRKRSAMIFVIGLIIIVGFLFNVSQLSNYIWLKGIIEICLIVIGMLVARTIFLATIGRVITFILEPRVFIAACFLGFASDIRTLGIASGIMVGIYSLVKNGRKAILLLAAYIAVGAVTIYLFWPYLWNSPLTQFFRSLSMAANFPQGGLVTFAGQRIENNQLPITYLPTLFGLQLTETALAVILVGIILAGIYIWKRKSVRLELLILGGWFLGPVAAAIILHSTLYNNFRQFLFIMPPLFVLAGLAIQKGWTYLKTRKKTAFFALLGLSLIVPGFYWDVRLHPFEYIYYNSLIGNVRGAYRLFPLDYWSTSFMTDIEYVNDTAPQNSTVFVDEPASIVKPYARPDLKIIARPLPANSINENYYAIFLAEDYKDEMLFPYSDVIFQVERDKALLSVVKIVQPWDQVWR